MTCRINNLSNIPTSKDYATIGLDTWIYPVKYWIPLIRFNANGGSDEASITVKAKDVLSAPKNPTKKGYKFAGWYTAAEGGKKVAFPYKVTGNVTLYAHWSKLS